MSESDIPLVDDSGLDDATRRLIGDLRALPRIAAPDNFLETLRRGIAETVAESADPATVRESWWSRFIASLTPTRVPMLATGAVAAVAIVAFGIYVYESRDVDQQLQSLPGVEHTNEDGLIGTEPEESPSYKEQDQPLRSVPPPGTMDAPNVPSLRQAPRVRPDERSTPGASSPASESDPVQERTTLRSAPSSDQRATPPAERRALPVIPPEEDVPVMRGVMQEEDVIADSTAARSGGVHQMQKRKSDSSRESTDTIRSQTRPQ